MKFEKIDDLNINYLSDESRLEGDADFIVFCESISDIKNAVKDAALRGLGITVQGARTGITGGAVPQHKAVSGISGVPEHGFVHPLNGQIALNLSKMKQVYSITQDTTGYRFKTGPGLTLTEIESILKGESFDTSVLDGESLKHLDDLKKLQYFFPPDPTEKSASIGGVVSNCASGSRSFFYGSARNFITSLDIVLADSSFLELKRSSTSSRASASSFCLLTKKGHEIKGVIPSFYNPECKNAAGLYTEKDMDMIDLFIGSEGILGIIASVEFLVIPEPEYIYGILIFPPDRRTNFALSEYFRTAGCKRSGRGSLTWPNCIKSSGRCAEKLSAYKLNNSDNSFIAAIEYFDMSALSLVKKYINEGAFKTLFSFSENSRGGALYIEIHSDNPDSGVALLESINLKLKESGVDENSVFVSDGKDDLSRMKDFRHSVPESVNMTIDRIRKGGEYITKLGTDFSVPDRSFRELFDVYFSDLETSGINSVVFGHIGNNHLHVNLIPSDRDEYFKGQELIKKWAEKVTLMGGTVSAEHGTGRLKKEYLAIMYAKEGIENIASLKAVFDPGFILNRGVMI